MFTTDKYELHVFQYLCNGFSGFFLSQVYQSWLDKSTPFYAMRWAGTLLLTLVYMIRVYLLQVIVYFCVFFRFIFN